MLSQYLSDDKKHWANVHYHKTDYIVKTDSGEHALFKYEQDAEDWAEDYVLKCNVKLDADEDKIILKPAKGWFNDENSR